MGNGARIGALILSGLLGLQGVSSVPAEEPPTEQTAAVTEAEELLLSSPAIYEHWLPQYCYTPAPEEEQGTVIKDQVPGHEEHPHSFTVYLPPHYAEGNQYDLVIFLGPNDGKPGDCVDLTWDTWYTDYFKFSDIYDQLILEKQVKPFILVQPDYMQWLDMDINYDTVSLSIKEELLPYIAEHYGTYAEDGSYDSLVAARDHIIMGGCSLGGMYTFRGLLRHCLDVASVFCPMSCYIDITKAQEDIRAMAEEYPLRQLIYTVGGIEEPRMKQMPAYLKTVLPEVFNDHTLTVYELEGTHHFYSTWAAGLWNSLQVCKADG